MDENKILKCIECGHEFPRKELDKYGSCPKCKKYAGYFVEDNNTTNHPSYYNNYSIEAVDMAEKIWGKEALRKCAEITAFFYRMRLGKKDDIDKDLAKEKWWLDKANKLSITDVDFEDNNILNNVILTDEEITKLSYEKYPFKTNTLNKNDLADSNKPYRDAWVEGYMAFINNKDKS